MHRSGTLAAIHASRGMTVGGQSMVLSAAGSVREDPARGGATVGAGSVCAGPSLRVSDLLSVQCMCLPV